MKAKHLFLLLILVSGLDSCRKEPIDTITLEGTIRDELLQTPIPGIRIMISAISSTGGFFGGRREIVADIVTDANGYYKVKLKIFKEAERLDFYINPGCQNREFVESWRNIDLSTINRSKILDYSLSPVAVLKINFRNANPVSSQDFFYFGWYSIGPGGEVKIIDKTDCGTVPASPAVTWTGMDVCGIFTVGAIAEQKTHVYWNVKKNGILNYYYDSVFVKRGVINNFYLNY